ncbi:MAG TPA: hypothetical protein VFS04_06575 [Alphaproteobacteria bacterium]|nr:hypothetical protein [Alphaproteobacteria bacterium]
MAIVIAPFTQAHLAAIAPGRFDAIAAEGLDLAALAASRADIGPAWTAVADGRVLGCAGIVPLWRGVGAGWLYAADEMRRYPVALHRTVLRGIAAAEVGLGLHRLQISVHEDFAASLAWVVRLGFACEGAMPGYGPNGDNYIRYARVT